MLQAVFVGVRDKHCHGRSICDRDLVKAGTNGQVSHAAMIGVLPVGADLSSNFSLASSTLLLMTTKQGFVRILEGPVKLAIICAHCHCRTTKFLLSFTLNP